MKGYYTSLGYVCSNLYRELSNKHWLLGNERDSLVDDKEETRGYGCDIKYWTAPYQDVLTQSHAKPLSRLEWRKVRTRHLIIARRTETKQTQQRHKSLTPGNDVRRNTQDASQTPTSAATATAARLEGRGHKGAGAPLPPKGPANPGPNISNVSVAAGEAWRSQSIQSRSKSANSQRIGLARTGSESGRAGGTHPSGHTPQSQYRRSRNSGLACGSQSLT